MGKLKRRLFTVAAALLLALTPLLNACSGCLIMSTREWVIQTIKNYYYEDIPDEILQNCDYKNLTGTVLDIYSGYYTAEEYRRLMASNAGSKSGLGVSYSYIGENYSTLTDGDGKETAFGSGIFINAVLGNSPAEEAGLKKGMFITGARTQDGTEVTFDSSASFSLFVDARATGEQFDLLCDGETYGVSSVTLSKEEYTASYCYMATNNALWRCTYNESGKLEIERDDVGMSCLPEGAAYFSLYQFYGNAHNEMAQLFKIFNEEKCTSLILDLRNNGGGYVEVMQYMAYLFTGNLDDAPQNAMKAVYKGGETEYFAVKKGTYASSCLLPKGTEIYVLANNNTASASEALIGVLVSSGMLPYDQIYLSDYSDEYLQFSGTGGKNARTYGKGIMQSMYTNIWTGEALKLTVAKIYWDNGKCIHDVGLTVEDGCRTVKALWSVTYGDEELNLMLDDAFASDTAAAA